MTKCSKNVKFQFTLSSASLSNIRETLIYTTTLHKTIPRHDKGVICIKKYDDSSCYNGGVCSEFNANNAARKMPKCHRVRGAIGAYFKNLIAVKLNYV